MPDVGTESFRDALVVCDPRPVAAELADALATIGAVFTSNAVDHHRTVRTSCSVLWEARRREGRSEWQNETRTDHAGRTLRIADTKSRLA